MTPSSLAPRLPFLLGSFALHMLTATLVASLPAQTSTPAEPIAYYGIDGPWHTEPAGEPDFYLVWTHPAPVTMFSPPDEQVIQCVIACPGSVGALPVEVAPASEDASEIDLQQLESALMRAWLEMLAPLDSTFRAPRGDPRVRLRR